MQFKYLKFYLRFFSFFNLDFINILVDSYRNQLLIQNNLNKSNNLNIANSLAIKYNYNLNNSIIKESFIKKHQRQ